MGAPGQSAHPLSTPVGTTRTVTTGRSFGVAIRTGGSFSAVAIALFTLAGCGTETPSGVGVPGLRWAVLRHAGEGAAGIGGHPVRPVRRSAPAGGLCRRELSGAHRSAG